jgi:hypothetical protein
LGRIDVLDALAKEAAHAVLPEPLDKTHQVGSYLQRSGIMDDEHLYLQTPLERLERGYHFIEVRNSAGLWARWKVFKGNQPRLVILTSDMDSPADGFEIHHSPSLVITPPSSETSESDSESTCTTSSSEPLDLISDSYDASEDGDDQEGRGTVAIVVAQITVGGLTAMPNVREKDVSISARNHEPHSFSQYLDNHERRPLAEVFPHPKLLVKAMELRANAGAYVDVPLEAPQEEIGEGGVVSHLTKGQLSG